MKAYFNFKYTRQSLGLFIVFMGNPLIFFFKEVLGFGGSSTFTIGSLLLGMILMISPYDIFRKYYKPNIPIARMAGFFLILSFLACLFYNPFYGYDNDRAAFTRDFGNFIFIFTFVVIILGVSNEIIDYFLPVAIALTFFGSICLIYSMATNPLFIIGQRATVVFGDGTTTASGNPHVYARNAFAGVFASYFFLKAKNIFWRLLSFANLILSVIVIILAQARSILLAFLFALALFFYFNVSKASVSALIRSLFRPLNLMGIFLFIAGLTYFISTQQRIVDIIDLYYNTFLDTFSRALLTAFGLQDEKSIDYSALGRVNNVDNILFLFSEIPYAFILGGGFRFIYVDIPIVETFVDLGIAGIVSFSLLNYAIFKEAIYTLKWKVNPFACFVAYFYMTYFVGIFTGGEPYGTSYWFIFIVAIRFLGIKYIEENSVDATREDNFEPIQPSVTTS